MQSHADYEQRYLRVASNFSPAQGKTARKELGRMADAENVTNNVMKKKEDAAVASEGYQRPTLTVAQPFRFQTAARRVKY